MRIFQTSIGPPKLCFCTVPCQLVLCLHTAVKLDCLLLQHILYEGCAVGSIKQDHILPIGTFIRAFCKGPEGHGCASTKLA